MTHRFQLLKTKPNQRYDSFFKNYRFSKNESVEFYDNNLNFLHKDKFMNAVLIFFSESSNLNVFGSKGVPTKKMYFVYKSL